MSYFGCVLDESASEASIYMELMPHSLVSIRAFGPMNENVLRRHTKQILEALVYLHNHERIIIHGDLKAANLLFDGKNVKLTDFGDSRILGTQIPNIKSSHSGVRFDDIKEVSCGWLQRSSKKSRLGQGAIFGLLDRRC